MDHRDRVKTNSRYLKARDVLRRQVHLTIARIPEDDEEMEDGDLKTVIYFEETDKGLVLNQTNSDQIAELYGDEMNDWIGKCITLGVGDTRNPRTGLPCKGIRVQQSRPPQSDKENTK